MLAGASRYWAQKTHCRKKRYFIGFFLQSYNLFILNCQGFSTKYTKPFAYLPEGNWRPSSNTWDVSKQPVVHSDLFLKISFGNSDIFTNPTNPELCICYGFFDIKIPLELIRANSKFDEKKSKFVKKTHWILYNKVAYAYLNNFEAMYIVYISQAWYKLQKFYRSI